ncbi:MAG: hypothetical protein K9J17_06265 [Flavobacteriales bacterium]|nr:hypothetical protein [Flavobacteriales bacterium]
MWLKFLTFFLFGFSGMTFFLYAKIQAGKILSFEQQISQRYPEEKVEVGELKTSLPTDISDWSDEDVREFGRKSGLWPVGTFFAHPRIQRLGVGIFIGSVLSTFYLMGWKFGIVLTLSIPITNFVAMEILKGKVQFLSFLTLISAVVLFILVATNNL